MKIVADNQIPYIKEYFSVYGELILKEGRAIRREDVVDADVLIVRSVTPVNQSLLAGTQVKFVGSVTAGADHLDTNWLNEAGIIWTNARGFNAPPVADYVVSVIAALQQQKILEERDLRVAIIGVGNVGKLVTERLKALNYHLILCDPIRAERETNFISTPLKELQDLDLISLHVPLTFKGKDATYHFIDKTFLSRQKNNCVLLNASRGSVVNDEAILQCAKNLYLCFDVWEHEPKINKSILAEAVVATPHIAGYSIQSKIRGIDMIYRIACEKKIIAPQIISPITMPIQSLQFNEKMSWQEIVLAIFNPLIMTEVMRENLLNSSHHGLLFDEMRNKFNSRYEFGYTYLHGEGKRDNVILNQLGIKFT